MSEYAKCGREVGKCVGLKKGIKAYHKCVRDAGCLKKDRVKLTKIKKNLEVANAKKIVAKLVKKGIIKKKPVKKAVVKTPSLAEVLKILNKGTLKERKKTKGTIIFNDNLSSHFKFWHDDKPNPMPDNKCKASEFSFASSAQQPQFINAWVKCNKIVVNYDTMKIVKDEVVKKAVVKKAVVKKAVVKKSSGMIDAEKTLSAIVKYRELLKKLHSITPTLKDLKTFNSDVKKLNLTASQRKAIEDDVSKKEILVEF